MLTQDQIDLFHAFGFLHLRQLFDADEARYIGARFDAAPQGADGVLDTASPPLRELRDWLLSHDDIYDIPRTLFGEDFIYEGMGCQYYAEDSPWHADSAIVRWTFRHIKIALYLEPLTADSGCLRVIPGSHRDWLRLTDPRWAKAPDWMFGVKNRDMVWQYPPWGLPPDDVPTMPLETEPGDVLVFPEDLAHCTMNTKGPRRQIALALMENPRSDEQVFNLRQRQAYGGGSAYRPPRSMIEHPSPRIRRMVARMVELGFPPVDL